MRSFFSIQPATFILWIVVSILAGHVAQAGVRSLIWPLINDPPIFHYIASRILAGAVPYRDIYDMNMPLSYLLHMVCLALFGNSDAAFRYFDFLWLILIGAVMVAFCRRRPGPCGLLAALLFASHHLSGGAYAAGQRDFFMVLFLLGAAQLAVKHLTSELPTRALLRCGVCLGLAFLIKPHAIIYAGLVWMIVMTHPSARFERFRLTCILAVGWLLPVAAVMTWLGISGGLGAFIDMIQDLLGSNYSSMDKVPLIEKTWVMFILAAMCSAILPMGRAGSEHEARNQLLLAGIIYGWLQYYFQQRGWGYQLYPFWAFVFLLFAYNLPSALLNRPVFQKLSVYGSLAALCWMYSPSHFYDPKAFYAYMPVKAYMDEMQNNLKRAQAEVPPAIANDSEAKRYPIHFIDFTEAHLWNMAYRLGWAQASRHIYPFPLILDRKTSPRIQTLHDELINDLNARLPQVLVISRQTSPYRREFLFEILDKNKDFSDLLREHYKIVVRHQFYWVYARKS